VGERKRERKREKKRERKRERGERDLMLSSGLHRSKMKESTAFVVTIVFFTSYPLFAPSLSLLLAHVFQLRTRK